jgi:hypothetical protein
VGKTNTVIEINGTRYDANTGERLASAAGPVHVTVKHVAATAKAQPQPEAHRQSAHHVAAHTPKHAQTLMRQSVKKPTAATHLKASVPINALTKAPLAAVTLPQSAQQLNPHRLSRAQRVKQSTAIQHFSAVPPTAGSVIAPIVSTKPAIHHAAAPAPHVSTTTNDLLERALQAATSHEQPAHKLDRKHHSKRRLRIGGAVALSLLVLGVVGSQNLPNLRLHEADAKAGFTATLPAHQPAGYRLSQMQYSAGQVASQFQSNSSDTSYSLTQKPTLWDSTALRDNFVAPADSHYRTLQSNGQTVYIYGNQNATWVNNGIWYQLQSDGSLSDSELLNLATNQ